MAVGYELNADLVAVSRDNARQAGVEPQVTFVNRDLFTADLSGADVLAVYLLPQQLEKLLPQLEKMKPGSRVVSHQFEIPGQPPDQIVRTQSSDDGLAHAAYLWTLPLSKLVRRIQWPGNHIFHTAFSPDGQFYLGGGDASTLRVWETATGKQVAELPVTIGDFTPDGKQVIGYHLNKTIWLFDLASGREIRKWNVPSPIVGLAIAPDGRHVATGHADNMLRLWDFASGNEVRRFEGHSGPASVVFSPDSTQIVSGSEDKMIRLWDVESGRLLRTFTDFQDAVPVPSQNLIVRAYFAADGKQIAGYVWGKNKTLMIWKADTGDVIRQLDLGADHHKDLAISPDGRWCLTGHEDRTVRLRDLATGDEVRRYVMQDVNVPRALNFSPDGRFAVAGSHRSWIMLWQLPPAVSR